MSRVSFVKPSLALNHNNVHSERTFGLAFKTSRDKSFIDRSQGGLRSIDRHPSRDRYE